MAKIARSWHTFFMQFIIERGTVGGLIDNIVSQL